MDTPLHTRIADALARRGSLARSLENQEAQTKSRAAYAQVRNPRPTGVSDNRGS